MYILSLLLLSIFLGAARMIRADANAEYEASGAQYILYSGSISANVSYSSQLSSSRCPALNTPSYTNTHLYVGKNPPWDPNPFFFELYHSSSDGGILTK